MSDCYFTSLSPELVDKVFSSLDSVSTLANLVISSRFLHRCFVGREALIILRVLENELGPVLVDAKFLSMFPRANPGKTTKSLLAYCDKIHTMSSLYMRMLGNNALSEQGNRAFLSLAEVTQACRTLRRINFLAEVYIDTHLMSLGTEGAATAPVSRTERLRVLRALYRRQIICNAWAPTRREPEWNEQDTAAIGNTSSHRQVRLGLFAAFEPWELQQVDHIDFFVTRICRALYFSRQEAARPISEAEFGEMFSQTDYLVQYMQKHPNIAKAALRTVQSPPRLTNYEPHNATYHRFADRYSLLCMHFAWQSYRLETFPDPVRDHRGQQASSNEARVDFIGDAVDLVPFGWTDALNQRYVNWFGDALLDMAPWMPESDADEEPRLAQYASLGLWRNAGFALWDKKRVEALKEVDSLRTLSTGWLDY